MLTATELTSLTGPLDAEHQNRILACLDLLLEMARVSRRLQGEVEAFEKADASPVSVVDLLHQALFQRLLQSRFPEDALLCEEPAHLQRAKWPALQEIAAQHYGSELGAELAVVPEEGRFQWVMDPIDGTKGFLAGRHFAIAVGYFFEGAPFFGALAVPHQDDGKRAPFGRAMAFALQGRGCWWRSIEESAPWQVAAPRPEIPAGPLRVAISLAHSGDLGPQLERQEGLEIVRLDSSAKYFAAAMGEIDAYVRVARDDGHPDVLWDHYSGGLVAVEAGCRLTHFDGAPIDFRAERAVIFKGGLICLRGGIGDAEASVLLRQL